MLSIITDFGCGKDCPYCIYRHMMPSKIGAPDDYYERLELAIRNVPGDVFSISGGGDPLFNFGENDKFWSHIYRFCHTYDKRIDIHTAYLQAMNNYYPLLAKVLHKIVIHCFPDTWEEDKYNLTRLLNVQPSVQLRINFVIDYQLDTIASDVEAFCHEHKIPFSYRQMVGSDLQAVTVSSFYTEVASRTQYGRYVEQDDYNIYFTPQGELKLKFMEI